MSFNNNQPATNDDVIDAIINTGNLNPSDLLIPDDLNQVTTLPKVENHDNELQLTSPTNTQLYNNLYDNNIDEYLAHPSFEPPTIPHIELKQEDLLKIPRKESSEINNLSNNVTNGGSKPKSLSTANQPKSHPAFVAKLWSMINDKDNSRYMRWTEDGKSFKVLNREAFMREVLPKYFKHSNFSSFVRQLNMYGWHKVQDVKSAGTISSNDEIWQFENPYFQRGREDLLEKIVRNKSGKSGKETEELDVDLVVNELNKIKNNQSLIANDLQRVRKDNSLLWQEVILARERYNKQNETLNTILRFVASIFQGNSNLSSREIGFDGGNNNNLLTALFDAVKKSNNPTSGNTNADISSLVPANNSIFDPVNSDDIQPIKKPRLMLTSGDPDFSISQSSPASIRTIEPSNTANSSSLRINELPSEVLSSDDLIKSDSLNKDISKITEEVNGNLSPSYIGTNNEVVKSSAPESNSLSTLQSTISKQEETINNLADLLSQYIPESFGDEEEPTDFNVDEYLLKSSPSTENITETPNKRSISEIYDDPNESSSDSAKKPKK